MNGATLNFIVDKEIDLNESNDLFESLNYSKSLVNIIESAPTSSFTIGLFGEWGTGKSSIVKSANNILNKKKSKKYHFFTYDAWKYSKDSFRRTFLLNLSDSLSLDGDDLFDSFYKTTKEPFHTKTLYNKSLIVFSFIAIVTILSLSEYTGKDWAWTLQTVLMVCLISVNLFSNITKQQVSFKQNKTLFSPEQFEDCLDEMLYKALKTKTLIKKFKSFFKKGRKDLDRIVITVDNIDRCDAQTAYNLLSDFKNFLDKERVIFIVPVDDNALRQHVNEFNGYKLKEADEFLRKLFNNTLKIKPYKAHDLYNFTVKLNEKHNLSLKPDTIDVIAKEYATNPRRIIQFLNSLTSELDYIYRRYTKSFSTQYQTQVAMMLILREEWPPLFKYISEYPYKLNNYKAIKAIDTNIMPYEASSYLRKTFPHLDSIDESVIRKIISDSPENSLPDSVINAINKREFKAVEEFSNSSENNYIKLVIHYINEFEIAAERNVISSLSSSFNDLLYLNSQKDLSNDEHNRIYGILNNNNVIIKKCVINIDNPDSLAKYIDSAEKYGITYISDNVVDIIEESFPDEFSDTTNVTLDEKYIELVKSIVNTTTNKRLLKKFQKSVLIILLAKELCLHDFVALKENIQHLANRGLVSHLVKSFDLYHEDTFEEFSIYAQQGLISDDNLSVFIKEFTDNNGNLTSVETKNFILHLSYMTEIFNAMKYKISECSQLDEIINTVFSIRNVAVKDMPPQNDVYILDEIKDDEEKLSVLTDWLLSIYHITRGSDLASSKLVEIAGLSEQHEINILTILNDFHKKHTYIFTSFISYISSSALLCNELYTIVDWLIKSTSLSENDLNNDQLDVFLSRCISLLIEGDSKTTKSLVTHLEKWIKIKRVKDITSKIICLHDSDEIKTLPKVLQKIVFSYICNGKNIFEYSDQLEMLSAISAEKNNSYNKQIEKVILEKLSNSDTAQEGLDIITKMQSFRGMSKTYLRDRVSEYSENEDLKDNIETTLEFIESLK